MISVLLTFALIALCSLLLWCRKHYSYATVRQFVFHLCPASARSRHFQPFYLVLCLFVATMSADFFQFCCSCYSWALQRVCQWRKCPSRAALYGQAKHFLRSHNLISLRSTVSTHFCFSVFSVLCIWAKVRRSHWFDFPAKGSRLCLCNIVLLFHSKALTGGSHGWCLSVCYACVAHDVLYSLCD